MYYYRAKLTCTKTYQIEVVVDATNLKEAKLRFGGGLFATNGKVFGPEKFDVIEVQKPSRLNKVEAAAVRAQLSGSVN